MSRIASLVTVLAVLAALFHSGPQQAWACTCRSGTGSEWAQRLLTHSDMLVVARVESVTGAAGKGSEVITARVRVDQQFRGNGDRTLDVRTSESDASCGYTALIDEEWHLLAIGEQQGEHWVDLCSSFPLQSNEIDLKTPFFATLAAAAPPVTIEDEPDARFALAYIVASIVALAAVVAVGSRTWTRR